MSRLSVPLSAATLLASLSGPSTAFAQTVLHEIPPSVTDSCLGELVRAAGDVDGDGTPDALLLERLARQVLVVSGRTGGTLQVLTEPSTPLFALSCDTAGDVDGDGHADVLVGGHSAFDWGYYQVRSGLDGSILRWISGTAGFDFFGSTVATVGDVDLDGFVDHAAGAYSSDLGGSNAGLIEVRSGATGQLLHGLTGSKVQALLGRELAGGDFDGDGRADVLSVEAPPATLAEVVAFAGLDGAPILKMTAPSPTGGFGTSLSGVGDFDHDGHDEVAVGAPTETVGTDAQAGVARVFSGKTGSLLFALAGGPSETFGTSVAAHPDLDGDGTDEVLVGAAVDTGLISAPGAVHVASGATGQVLLTVAGAVAGEEFGFSVASLGDVDGDARADIVAGAPIDCAGVGVARIVSLATGPFQNYGHGCPAASGGIPTMRATGTTGPAGTIRLWIEHGTPLATAVCLFGVTSVDLPLFGECHLLVGGLLPIAPIVSLSPVGEAQLDLTVPSGLPTFTLRTQTFVGDVGHPLGFHVSNGVAIEMP